MDRLGSSQRAVLCFLQDHPKATTQEVGNALYDKVSEYARYVTSFTATDKHRYQWAQRILSVLRRKDLVEEVSRKPSCWECTTKWTK